MYQLLSHTITLHQGNNRPFSFTSLTADELEMFCGNCDREPRAPITSREKQQQRDPQVGEKLPIMGWLQGNRQPGTHCLQVPITELATQP